MPRIAKVRTYFLEKKFWGRTPRRPQTPLWIQLFLSFFFVAPPHFSAPSYATDIYKCLQIWMLHYLNLYVYRMKISIRTLNIKKIDRAKLGVRSIYLRIHVKLLDFQGRGELPLSLLSRRRFRKFTICFIFSSYRSIYDNKKVDRAFVYL